MILHFLQVFFRFLSTPSARRATKSSANLPYKAVFLSTPSARRATSTSTQPAHAPCISIHTLREEGDDKPYSFKGETVSISIHTLREEGDGSQYAGASGNLLFLSTPSARRATKSVSGGVFGERFLSTPSARRATFCCRLFGAPVLGFLSTPSARRATVKKPP